MKLALPSNLTIEAQHLFAFGFDVVAENSTGKKKGADFVVSCHLRFWERAFGELMTAVLKWK